MITLTLIVCVVMLLLWLGLASMGAQPSDGLFTFLLFLALFIVFGVLALIMGWFDSFFRRK